MLRMEVAAALALTSAEGRALLAALPPYSESATAELDRQLREAGYPASLVSAALTQSRLRTRARTKLGEFADGMLFTPDGLEQATRLELAARHAQRFRAAGIRHVLDLGCGLGVDAMALASLDLSVQAWEADPATALLAQYNLRHFPDVLVRTGLAQDAPMTSAGIATGAWLDPARRQAGHADITGRTRRVFALNELSPPWSFVQEVAQHVPATGAKLSPAFPRNAIPPGAQAQWTSFQGEVLECVLWWGPLASTVGPTATVIRADQEVTLTSADSPGLGPVATALPAAGTWIYEPEGAVIQAGLVGALIAAVDGLELSTGVGYVGSSVALDLGYARRYRVLEAMPLRPKVVRAWLRERGIGRLTIKKRGISVDTDQLRRSLRLDAGGELATAIVTRAGATAAFIAVEGPIDGPARVTIEAGTSGLDTGTDPILDHSVWRPDDPPARP